ncbi:MAG: LLM class flavin-dependent oxidoreductase [Pseudochelatococcus sp.]|jgi:luciferase family oxidoreductase group 1|uniref:LLM class flavin-dependent oxidoreductase n=1 Tax=Pseudochelatococcus sp. TaxID=2020869 RepID=UPI003D90BCFB
MSYALSLLDKSPLQKGETAVEALARTVALARKAEQLGYRRFWVAEHHNSAELASPSPELLAAYLAANTARIRIGTGGVMLQHYSAYKVAENFKLLASLAPGRIDLGVGKAPGGLPLSTRALQWHYDQAGKPGFAEQVAQIAAFLGEGFEAPHPLAGVKATPEVAIPPERFLLGTGEDSAALAARHGWGFVYAAHLNGDAAHLERALDAYRAGGGATPIIALAAIVAEDPADIAPHITDKTVFRVTLNDGRSVNVGSRERVENFLREVGVDPADTQAYRVAENRPSILHGTPDAVERELEALGARYGVHEFIIDLPVADEAVRFGTAELLARRRLDSAA